MISSRENKRELRLHSLNRGAMKRRDFVKAIVAAPVVAQTGWGQQATPTPPPATVSAAPQTTPLAAPPAAARGARRGLDFTAPPISSIVPDAVATPKLGFFTTQQFAALRRLSDLLMPPLNGYPGAVTAGVPEFLDFLISASLADTQLLYRSGLDRLNADARKKFSAAFADLDDKQADAIVRPGLKPWMQWHPPTEPFAHFIAVAYDDIRKATTNSEAWNAAAVAAGERAPGVGLYWSPIDPDMKKWV
jgi:hypothetical protein